MTEFVDPVDDSPLGDRSPFTLGEIADSLDFEDGEVRDCELCGDPVEPFYVGEPHQHYASWTGPLIGEFIRSDTQPGAALRVRHHSTELDEVIAVMVGDNRPWRFSTSDLTVIPREAFCGECGALGCRCDGLDRDDYNRESEEEEDE